MCAVEPKNSWQLAEHIGAKAPYNVQYLLDSIRWSPESLRNEVRACVQTALPAGDVVLVIDETGLVEGGQKSADVQRQHSGTAGRIGNCQVGVLLALVIPDSYALIDRALYIPRKWTDDEGRCQEARLRGELEFRTKPQLAKEMLEQAYSAGIRARWVVADSAYGKDAALRRWLE